MKVKGTILSSAKSFVKDNFPNRFDDWLSNLSPESKDLYTNPVLASEWYDINVGLFDPTNKIAEMFYNKDINLAAWEMGRYSAEVGLKGIYKVFILIATPQFIMKRGGKILSSFYNPCDLTTGEIRPKGVDIIVKEFPGSSEITESRIGGWMEKALEITNVKNISIDKVKSLAKGDELTKYVINWE